MRIAMLGPYPQDPGTDVALIGGVDAVVVALAHGLTQRPGTTVHLVTAVPGLTAPETRQLDGLVLHRVPRPRGGRLMWHRPVVKGLLEALHEIQPDVVHAHGSGPYAAAALQSRRPNVITLHGMIFREAALGWSDSSWPERLRWQWDALYERWVVRGATDIIAINPYVAREFTPLTQARFHAIENPVEDRFFAVPDEVPGGHNILCVARVIPRKDILTLLRVFALVLNAVPAATLTIAGETDSAPDYFAACQDLAGELGIGQRVQFIGNLNRSALTEAYAAASVVALTSRQETAPVTVAEAMAAGRAVVATRAGGMEFMIADGETGLLAAVGDAATLGQHLTGLLENAPARHIMGRRGREIAESRFRLSRVVNRTLDLYAELITRRSHA